MAISDHSRAGLATSRMFAHIFQAYLECDPAIQEVIREMVAIVNDPDVDEDDRAMALATLDEALFPTHSPFDGQLGLDLVDLERHATGAEAAAQEAMDQEETDF